MSNLNTTDIGTTAAETKVEKKTTTSFLTVDEMADTLSIARATAYQLTKMNDFPCFHIGKRIIIPTEAFNDWVIKQATSKTMIIKQ